MLNFGKNGNAEIRKIETRLLNFERKIPPQLFTSLSAVLLLLTLSFFTRLGSLLTEVYNWDESTFIVISSGVANGILPYIETWDIKPPGLFFALGGSLAVFGDTLFSVRIFGAVCVFVMALSTYFVCRRVMNRGPSVSAGLFVVCAMTVGEAQAVYTETLAIALVMLGLCFLVYAEKRIVFYLIGGILIGAAVLTRTNIAFLALGLGGYYFFRIWVGDSKRSLVAFALFTIGGGSVLGLVLLPFFVEGQMQEFWFANVTVPLNYASNQLSPLVIFFLLLLSPFAIAVAYPAACGIPVFLIVRHLKRSWLKSPKKVMRAIRDFLKTNHEWWLIIFSGCLVVFGMCVNGAATWHHLIQIVPFLAIAAGARLEKEERPIFKYLVAITVLVSLARTLPATSQVVWQGVDAIAETRPIAKISQHIKNDRDKGDQVFALSGHLIYWYLNQPPPNKYATHPSNALKSVFIDVLGKYGRAEKNMIGLIFGERPKYIILHPTRNKSLKGATLHAVIKIIDADYEVWNSEGEYTVYRRRE